MNPHPISLPEAKSSAVATIVRRALRTAVLAISFTGLASIGAAIAVKPSRTTTSLLVSSSSPAADEGVWLTATVSNGSPVAAGTVTFCDASRTYCKDSALLGTAQLTADGTAMIKIIPGIGTHSYRAVFEGNSWNLKSSSLAQEINVTGKYVTRMSISSVESAGNYELTGTVEGQGSIPDWPSGSVTFIDETSNQVIGSGSLVPAGGIQLFRPQSQAATGREPHEILNGDFNMDGKPDLVVVNRVDNTVGVFIGHGDGYFEPQTTYETGASPTSAAVADFNGDGYHDLAVANSSDATLSVLLGNGDGTFQEQRVYGMGLGDMGYLSSLVAGDYNKDGFLDVAVVRVGELESQGGVSLLQGMGEGTFEWIESIELGIQANSGARGDLDGDGNVDLVVRTAGRSARLLRGLGNGSFESLPTLSSLSDIDSLSVGDFNDDGTDDLAALNSTDNSVTIWLSDGNGSFLRSDYRTTGGATGPIVATDLNGDGITDVVLANSASGRFEILIGIGNGAFRAGESFGDIPDQCMMSVLDFNGDGLKDVACTSITGDTIHILLNCVLRMATVVKSSISIPGVGTHQVTAKYDGDIKFGGSAATPISLIGTIVPTSLTLAISPIAGSIYGQDVLLTATLEPSAAGHLTSDSDIVTFKSREAVLGFGMLNSGIATLVSSALPVGTNTIRAEYAGNTNFDASTSAEVTLAVVKSLPLITLNTSTNSVMKNANLTVTATMASAGSDVPQGSVHFYEDNRLLGSGTLSEGRTTCSISTLAVGPHQITASYEGDDNFAGATSSPVRVTVQDFTIDSSPNTPNFQTTIAGGETAYQLTLKPTEGPTLPADIQLSVSGLPVGATATITPQAIASGAGTTQISLTIHVPAQTVQAHDHGFIAGTLAFVVIGMVSAFRLERMQSNLKYGAISCVLLLTTCLIGLAGCGDGGKASTGAHYDIEVKAKSATLSHSTILELILQ